MRRSIGCSMVALLLLGTRAWAGPGAAGEEAPRKERSLGEIAIELAGQDAFLKRDARWEDRMQARMEPLRKELDDLKSRLEALSGSYPGLQDLEAAGRQRSELRATLSEKRDRLAGLLAQFRGRQGADMLVSIRQAMEKKKEAGTEKTLERFLSTSGFGQGVSIALGGARTALEKDEAAFSSAEVALARWRARKRAGAAATACLLLGLAAYSLRARSRRGSGAPAPSMAGAGPGSQPRLSQAPGSAAALSAAAAGMVAGNFQLLRELGDGGSRVFEARDLRQDRLVVLKGLRPELTGSPRELERFLAEAKRVASLEHARLARLHGFAREGPDLYLVLEHVPGETLARVLEARGPFPLASALEVLAQAGEALDYAHGQGVLHQALAPSNILMAEDGSVKISDFGLAQLSRLSAARISGAAFPAKLAYLAPEVELGEAGEASDLYSLAVCLYEMLAGRPPFAGPNFLAQKRGLRLAPLQAAGLPTGLDAVVLKALSPDPDLRHRSAAELAAALSAAAHRP